MTSTPSALTSALIEVLSDDVARERYVEAASKVVRRYDWSVVGHEILRVYETVAGAGVKVQVAGSSGSGQLPRAGEGEAARGVS